MARATGPSTNKPAGAGTRAGMSSSALAAAKRRGNSKQSTALSRPAGQGLSNGMLKYYTDDAPGLKIGPTAVLVCSLCFIAFVVILHIQGKFRR